MIKSIKKQPILSVWKSFYGTNLSSPGALSLLSLSLSHTHTHTQAHIYVHSSVFICQVIHMKKLYFTLAQGGERIVHETECRWVNPRLLILQLHLSDMNCRESPYSILGICLSHMNNAGQGNTNITGVFWCGVAQQAEAGVTLLPLRYCVFL